MKKLFFFMFVSFSANVTQAQWWPDVRVTHDPYSSYSSIRRCVAANGDTVHVTWYDNSIEPHFAIRYDRSVDAGLNWDTEQQLTDGVFYDDEPSIVSRGSYVHVVWCYYESFSTFDIQIHYKRSTDGGNNWKSELPFTSGSGYKAFPAIAISGEYVHVVWYDECYGDWEIYYKRSSDFGSTWEENVRLTNQYDNSTFCSIAASGSVLHVVWVDTRDGDKEIYYKQSNDNGTTWGEDTRLTFSEGDSRFPEIDASGSFVNIVWQDNRDGDYEIYSFCSIDGGLTWGQEQRLTYESSPSEFVSISVSGSESHVVWQGMWSGLTQIYYKNGHNYGLNWDEEERLINTIYNASYPSVAFSGEWLHVVWYDERDGNYEIYCKNKYIESAPAGQFSITPDALNLDTVYVDGYRIDSLQVYNYGSNALIIYSILTEPPFSLSLNSTDWTNTIKNIVVPGDPIGKKTIYARFHGIQPGWYSDSISIAIEDTLYLVTIEGTCKESPGFINEAECFPTSVYPNPAGRQLTVDSWQSSVVSRQSSVRLSIVDLYGREIKEFGNISSFPYRIDISDLSDGVYILRMTGEEGKSSAAKFLKLAE